ncbi:MAG TPA: selenocysteine-specific translation elongation factor [Anaerolineaceae bacterium]|nr:selenocysteine-specific translation elongation factor [Anaerolineaceae bacterium]HPN52900.1 selenocysteine-specific translation elongation factor [Anaerolineaceae bacterium]
MHVVGTAGHVDHGKSTLIEALTGTHPDRLKEEQEREMTIDLGFAWLRLPGGEEVGLVDVPGHRDFIENMLAGVGGIDAALFVVAADEGMMPQSREHLAILDILQIHSGIVVMTKIEMIDDLDWLDLVEGDIRQAVQGTVLQDTPVVRVSARAGLGLDELKGVLAKILASCPARPDLKRPRLPVDRVFSMPGFGTVVTGTLLDGSLRVGDEVVVLPEGISGRVRGLQTHRQKEEVAFPGSRTAVNLGGVSLEQVRRGCVVARPGAYAPTQWLDVSFRLLPDASGPLRHQAEIKFYLGAAEVMGRVRLLGAEELKPGETGWLQILLNTPVVAVRGDRYLLRRPSPGETLGGGMVVDAQPAERHKRFDLNVLESLSALARGTPEELLVGALQALGSGTMVEAAARARLTPAQAAAALEAALAAGQVVRLEETGDGLLMTSTQADNEINRLVKELSAYHQAFPLRKGAPREHIKSRLKLPPRLFNALTAYAAHMEKVAEEGQLLRAASHAVKLTPAQQGAVERWLAGFARQPHNPPTVKEGQTALGEELFSAVVEMGLLKQVSDEVVFRPDDYEALKEWVLEKCRHDQTITVVEFRDRFQTSRRYALALLEYLDAQGVTVRDGDFRRLAKK